MNNTPKTDAKAERILAELGPNNNGRFAAMCDFARELERENKKLREQLQVAGRKPENEQHAN